MQKNKAYWVVICVRDTKRFREPSHPVWASSTTNRIWKLDLQPPNFINIQNDLIHYFKTCTTNKTIEYRNNRLQRPEHKPDKIRVRCQSPTQWLTPLTLFKTINTYVENCSTDACSAIMSRMTHLPKDIARWFYID